MDVEVKNPNNTQASWVNELSNPEVQEALLLLIQKLPVIKEAVVKAEQGVELATGFVSDSRSIDDLAKGVNQLSAIAMNTENLEALTTILDKLPRIAQTIAMLDRVMPLVETYAKPEFIQTLVETAGVLATPVTEKYQNGASIVKEAKERAEQNNTQISIFGVLKMLKDPAVQKGLKFSQALLEILSEKQIIK
jgi:uncharacterized protein YjgD (DUF1641 family)